MHRRDKTTDVMAQHLAQCFVYLCAASLAAERITELRLYHHKGRLRVRAFVIVSHESLIVVRKEVEHILPKFTLLIVPVFALDRAVRFERDIRHGIVVNSRLEILVREICFIRAHFSHREVLSGGINQRLEVWSVVGISIGDFNGCHNVGFHAAHEMYFKPFLLFPYLAVEVFSLHPLNEATGRKSRRICGKGCFDRCKRQTAFFYQHLQVVSEHLRFKVVKYTVIAGNVRDVALSLCVRQVRHKAASRNGAIDLVSHRKEHILKRQETTPCAVLCGRADALTELVKQVEEKPLLVHLRSMVRRPVRLRVSLSGDFDRLRCGRFNSAVNFRFRDYFALALDGDFYSVDMLAGLASELVVSAGTIGQVWTDFVFTFAALTWDKVKATFFNDSCSISYLTTFCFACRHNVSSLGKDTGEAYNLGCLGHIASAVWLNAVGEVDASPSAALLAEGVRFELTERCLYHRSLVSKASGFDRSPSPPLTSSFLFLFFCDSCCSPRFSPLALFFSKTSQRFFHWLCLVALHQPIARLSANFKRVCLSALYKPFQDCVDRGKRIRLLTEIIMNLLKRVQNISWSYKPIHRRQNYATSISKTKPGNLVGCQSSNQLHRLFSAENHQTINGLRQLRQLSFDFLALIINLFSPVSQLIVFNAGGEKSFFVIVLGHNQSSGKGV